MPARAGDAPAPPWPEPDGSLILARPSAGPRSALRLSRRVAGAVDTLTWDGVTFLADTEPGDALQARAEVGSGAGCRRASEAGTPAGRDRRARGTPAPRPAHRAELGRDRDPHGLGWALRPGRRARRGLSDQRRAGRDAGPGPAQADRPRPAGPRQRRGGADELRPVRARGGARLEPLAAAVPAEFSAAWRFDRATGGIAPLDPGPGSGRTP
ncbi:hypothetical protein ACU4GA_13845 [Methylobacterium oryzae CBMB20]